MAAMKYDYPEGLTTCDHLAHDIKQGRFPERSSIDQFICERENDGLIQPDLAPIDGSIDPCDGSIAPSLQYTLIQREALKLLAAEDERQSKLHELLETIREQIRLEVAPEHRPDGLFKNIQDAVYAMRGRTRVMDDAAITSVLSTSHGDAPVEYKAWFELREPGRVPERKGPFIGDRAKQFLRELMDARPRAFITVVTVGHDGPDFEDGPECLEIWDGRYKNVARRHRESSKEAFSRPARCGGKCPTVTLEMEQAGREWARLHDPSTFADIFEAMWKAMPKLAHKDGARIA